MSMFDEQLVRRVQIFVTFFAVANLFAQTTTFMQAEEMGLPRNRAERGAKVYAVNPLQAQLDGLPAGDTLRVAPGFYFGNLRLTKRVTLLGENWPVLSAERKGSVIEILADSCEIRGLIIEQSGRQLTDEDAGVLVWSHGNRITQTRDGIYMQYAPQTTIIDNLISEVRYGLHYMYSDSNTFVDNTFSRSLAGAAIMYSDHIVFKRNRFIQNRDFSAFGLLFQDCSFCLADSNLIADNGTGIFLEAAVNNVFRNNRIVGNDVALQIFSSSNGNVFTRNSFEDNRSPLFLVGKRTGTIWQENGIGNYWSGYEGYDLQADGIGDVPYRIQNIFDYIEGKHPALRLFLESPASEALAAATKTFPIFDISPERDDYPLMQPLDFALRQRSAPMTHSQTMPMTLGSLSLVVVCLVVLRRIR